MTHFLLVYARQTIYFNICPNFYAQVMDFSQAERLGFILAFKLFWNGCQDGRSDEELEEAAERILRSCEEHFRQSVTQVC